MSIGAVHRLSVPAVSSDGSVIRAVIIRRPGGKELKRLRRRLAVLREIDFAGERTPAKIAAGVEAMIAAVGVLTDIGEDIAAELDYADVAAICGRFTPHLGRLEGRGRR